MNQSNEIRTNNMAPISPRRVRAALCFSKVVPVTCLYAGRPELYEKVAECIKVHQNNEKAVAFGLASSCILEAVLLGDSLSDALKKCLGFTMITDTDEREAVNESFSRARAFATNQKSLEELITELSARSCALPGSFTVPIYELFKAAQSNKDQVYEEATRENILGAGDTCGRASILGAILAAATGGPPQSWVNKVDTKIAEKVDTAANAIADANAAMADRSDL